MKLQTDDAMKTFDDHLTSSTGDSLPPRVYVIGQLKEKPKALIKIADISYSFDDPLLAFDTFFKVSVGIKLQFPRQSIAVWSFIDRFVYKLDYIKINNSQIDTIINEMKRFSEKQQQ